jgi:hypothetical protein
VEGKGVKGQKQEDSLLTTMLAYTSERVAVRKEDGEVASACSTVLRKAWPSPGGTQSNTVPT